MHKNAKSPGIRVPGDQQRHLNVDIIDYITFNYTHSFNRVQVFFGTADARLPNGLRPSGSLFGVMSEEVTI
jgi:hypothetical protein